MYINTSPASTAPKKCINTGGVYKYLSGAGEVYVLWPTSAPERYWISGVYIDTSPASPTPDKCI